MPPKNNPSLESWSGMPKMQAKGFSLIEVLVGLIILAIGLLGLAGLQTHALRSNNSAQLHSQATIIAYDILERMRANRSYASLHRYDIAIGVNPSSALPRPTIVQRDIVQQDLTEWKRLMADALPGGDGSISTTTVGTGITKVTVIVQWHDIRKETVRFQTQSGL